ncbi:MAG: hypothetical protein IKK57_10860 [Clostridia bacterium]|nr:hypothetical protein [Clostridia bacterium]MBR6667589.1 hypothetical protein [Clostridia bacterium]
MKNVFAKVIARGSFDLNGILKNIDAYHIEGKLTDEERAELVAMARGDAKAHVNPAEEIPKLWEAIRQLRKMLAEKNGEIEEGVDEADVPEYVQPSGAHDAYFRDDMVKYNGKLYLCVAPDGVACVWSPDVMPGYWQVM